MKTIHKFLTLIVLIFLLCGTAVGQNTKTYVSGNWNVAGSWNPSGIPGSTDDVVISSSVSITNFASSTINSLTISGNSTVQITGNGQIMTINGILSIPSGNTLKMLSNTQIKAGTGFSASGTGSLFTAATTTALPAGVSGTNVVYTFDITLNAGGAQNLPAYATYTNLIVNLPTATTITKLGAGSMITGILTLTSGILDCVGNTFTMSSTASVNGGSSTSYIYMSSAAGALVRTCPQNSAILFPIGTASSYTPFTLTNKNGTLDITTKLKTSFTRQPLVAANCVNLCWFIVGSVATTADINFQFNSGNIGSGFNVNSGIELGNNTNAYSRVSTGTVYGSDPYSYIASNINIPASGINEYVFGNKAQIIAATVSGSPTINSITPGNNQLSVAFTVPKSDGGSEILNYEYSTNGGTSFTACSPAQTASPIGITGLTNGVSYNVQIRAINGVTGNGIATASTQATPSITSLLPLNNMSPISISVLNNEIIVSGSSGQIIELYNVVGRKISSTLSNDNTTRIYANGKGIYIIKVSNQTCKVIL